jgi:hypothetical protein
MSKNSLMECPACGGGIGRSVDIVTNTVAPILPPQCNRAHICRPLHTTTKEELAKRSEPVGPVERGVSAAIIELCRQAKEDRNGAPYIGCERDPEALLIDGHVNMNKLVKAILKGAKVAPVYIGIDYGATSFDQAVMAAGASFRRSLEAIGRKETPPDAASRIMANTVEIKGQPRGEDEINSMAQRVRDAIDGKHSGGMPKRR